MTERKLNSTNYHNQAFLEEKCALNELIGLLSKRWMTEVLFSVEEGNMRFSALKEDLIHISDHILANRLKMLERHGMITKHFLPGNFQRAEYVVTTKGAELSRLLDTLCSFAENQMQF